MHYQCEDAMEILQKILAGRLSGAMIRGFSLDQVLLFQGVSEVMLGKQAVQAVL